MSPSLPNADLPPGIYWRAHDLVSTYRIAFLDRKGSEEIPLIKGDKYSDLELQG